MNEKSRAARPEFDALVRPDAMVRPLLIAMMAPEIIHTIVILAIVMDRRLRSNCWAIERLGFCRSVESVFRPT